MFTVRINSEKEFFLLVTLTDYIGTLRELKRYQKIAAAKTTTRDLLKESRDITAKPVHAKNLADTIVAG